MAELVVIAGALRGLCLALEPGEHVVGRGGPATTLIIPDEAISREHCKLIGPEGAWRLLDLGSLNATYVNGHPVTEHALVDGDEIRIGESTLRFVEYGGELLGDGPAQPPTLRVSLAAGLAVDRSIAWRASCLDAMLALNDRVAAARAPQDALAALATWLGEVLQAQETLVFRRSHGRLVVVWSIGSGGAGTGTSTGRTRLLDPTVLDDAIQRGQTSWLAPARTLVAPLGGAPARYVVVAEGVRGAVDQRELQLVALAAGYVGGVLTTLERNHELEQAIAQARLSVPAPTELLTVSPAMRAVLGFIPRAAASEATVLVQGPSGSGKELVVRALHARGHRAAGPLVVVDCAALPETLLESELFGHERGAFTGAVAGRAGRFEQAHGGTLFLDEVGELSASAQARLLRALEDRTIQRIGGKDRTRVDVRVVAATHRDLRAMVRRGEFREDLFYRLAVLAITLPPLRDRPEDLSLLANHLLEQARLAMDGGPSEFAPDAMAALAAHAWPGNVRELRNVVDHAAAMAAGPAIGAGDLPAYLVEPAAAPIHEVVRLPASLRDLERAAVAAALHAAGGNKSKAARTLGIERCTLYAKLRQYGLGDD